MNFPFLGFSFEVCGLDRTKKLAQGLLQNILQDGQGRQLGFY
jgi:hypothetical protein